MYERNLAASDKERLPFLIQSFTDYAQNNTSVALYRLHIPASFRNKKLNMFSVLVTMKAKMTDLSHLYLLSTLS